MAERRKRQDPSVDGWMAVYDASGERDRRHLMVLAILQALAPLIAAVLVGIAWLLGWVP